MKSSHSNNQIFLFLITILSILPLVGISNSVSVNALTPVSPAKLNFGEKVTISFNYNISAPVGARIFIRPFTGTLPTPNYTASGSTIYKGKGDATATFTVTAGETTINQLRIQVFNATQSQLIFEFYFPVNYTYSPKSAILSNRAIDRQLNTDIKIHPIQSGTKTDENETTDKQEYKPITKRILPDGKIEITYPDGRIVTKYKGGFKEYDPATDKSVTYSYYTQARAVIPPSLPEGEELIWMETHSENLLSIIKTLVNFDATSIENYLQSEGVQDIYNQIVTREETISYMITP